MQHVYHRSCSEELDMQQSSCTQYPAVTSFTKFCMKSYIFSPSLGRESIATAGPLGCAGHELTILRNRNVYSDIYMDIVGCSQ